MGRVVIVNFVSIDGVIQSPLSPDEDRDGGFAHGGWVATHSDDIVSGFMQDATVGAAGMLLGRRSYEILVDAWAKADDSEPAGFTSSSHPGRCLLRLPPRRPNDNVGDFRTTPRGRHDTDQEPEMITVISGHLTVLVQRQWIPSTPQGSYRAQYYANAQNTIVTLEINSLKRADFDAFSAQKAADALVAFMAAAR